MTRGLHGWPDRARPRRKLERVSPFRLSSDHALEPAGSRRDALARRLFLRAALLGAGAVLGGPVRAYAEAEAPPPQMTQQEAAYQDAPRNGLSCASCSFFRPPRACAVVQGDISPVGWCKFFDLPD